MAADASPHVTVIGLGGTIAMTSNSTGGVTPTLSADELLAAVPALTDTGIDLDVVDLRRLPGASLDFADLDELVDVASGTVAAGATGVVVTQGTDTIEEVGYYLDLRYAADEPLIITGAMRNPTMAGADGAANLLGAIVTAAAPAARGRGVLVVLNDEIHAARRVRKTHTTSTGAFASPDGGPIGYLVEGRPRWLCPAQPRRLMPRVPAADAQPRVAIHTVVLGDDPALLAGIADRVDGLVVAGMGVGHVPQALVEPLAEAAAVIPVVLTSRVGRGPSLTGTYGFSGSERDLLNAGLIPAGFLDPLKARILLRSMLAARVERGEMVQAIAVAGGLTDGPWPWSSHEFGGH
jgi:L-asparaginase